jgi:hypothetical protein
MPKYVHQILYILYVVIVSLQAYEQDICYFGLVGMLVEILKKNSAECNNIPNYKIAAPALIQSGRSFASLEKIWYFWFKFEFYEFPPKIS